MIEVVQAVEGEKYWKATSRGVRWIGANRKKSPSGSDFWTIGIAGKFLIYKKDCVIYKGIRSIRCL